MKGHNKAVNQNLYRDFTSPKAATWFIIPALCSLPVLTNGNDIVVRRQKSLHSRQFNSGDSTQIYCETRSLAHLVVGWCLVRKTAFNCQKIKNKIAPDKNKTRLFAVVGT